MDSPGNPKGIVAGVIGLLLAAAVVSALRGALDRRPSIRWEPAFADARLEARRLNRPLMVVFEAPWCGWCARMERQCLRDSAVVNLSRRFVCVRVDVDRQPDIAAAYGGWSVPYLAFLAPDGAKVRSVAGFAEAGEVVRAMTDALRTCKGPPVQ
ncbi:MAG: thioredoxin family protein [Chthonomonadales bacterium]